MAQFDYKKEYDKYMKDQYGRKYNKKTGSVENRRSVRLIIGLLVAFAYFLLLLWVTWGNTVGTIFDINATAEKLLSNAMGSYLVTWILKPHEIFLFLGLLFNFLGWYTRNRGLVITCAIFYTVSLLCMPLSVYVMLIPTVLSYVAFATMKL